LILRELCAGGYRFNDIRRGVPLISRSLLTRRLRELEDGGVIVSQPLTGGRGREYRLTKAGEQFRAVLDSLGEWGQRWATAQFDVDNLDVLVLMWAIRRRIDVARLPRGRTVVRFDYRGLPARYRTMRTFWLLLQRPEPDICLKDPGFDVDLVVSADARAMAQVWTGHVPFAHAVRAGEIHLAGSRALVQAFPGWLLLSPFANVERMAAH
jgi:DNA-binding HxlR family transcriptional regulator